MHIPTEVKQDPPSRFNSPAINKCLFLLYHIFLIFVTFFLGGGCFCCLSWSPNIVVVVLSSILKHKKAVMSLTKKIMCVFLSMSYGAIGLDFDVNESILYIK